MKKALLELKSCRQCPFFKEERMYTEDSCEIPYNWFCKKENGKKIAGYVEWHEEKSIKIPDWCPLLTEVKED